MLELEDCGYDLLANCKGGDNASEIFKDADVVAFFGGLPRNAVIKYFFKIFSIKKRLNII